MATNLREGKAINISETVFSKIRKHLVNKRQRLVFDIAWWTGERIGAVCQLRVEDAYLDALKSIPREYLTFRAATRKADTKGKRRTRQVPIHPQLRELLEAYSPPVTGWLFPNRLDADQHLDSGGAAWYLSRALEKAKLGGCGIKTHSFRRSFITRLSECGIDPRVIQEITGHQSLTALQRYIEVSPARVKQAISLL